MASIGCAMLVAAQPIVIRATEIPDYPVESSVVESETVPDVPETVPDVPEIVPEVPETVPDVPETVPEVVETIPEESEVESEVEDESFAQDETVSESVDMDGESDGSDTDGDSTDSVSGNDITDEWSIAEQLKYLVENASFVSGNGVRYGDDIGFYDNYNAYYGSISSTYLEYFRGFLCKLLPNQHYVAARVSQYDYIFAYGENLSFDGVFSGTDICVVTFNTYQNGSYSSSVESNFSLNPRSYLVYSDLSDIYPSLMTSSDISLRQVVIFIAIFVVFYTLTKMASSGGVKYLRRSRR